jgi:hypothetical protein
VVSLPKVQTADPNFMRLQTQWAAQLDFLLQSQITKGVLLQNVDLKAGVNYVSHLFSRKLTGWVIVRQRSQSQLWDSQDSAASPAQILVLNTSADVTVDLWVF